MKMKRYGLFLGLLVLLNSQSGLAQESTLRIPVTHGSVAHSLKNQGLKKELAAQHLPQWLGLPDGYSVLKTSESFDKLGFLQEKYELYYRGIRLKEGHLVVHSKSGVLTSVHGRVSVLDEDKKFVAGLSKESALQQAKDALGIRRPLRSEAGELVILKDKQSAEFELAWKVAVDGKNLEGKLIMADVYVHATTGKVIETVSRIAHVDVQAQAKTLYSGIQEITTDSFSNGYRLRDNGRKIETYDVGGSAQNPDTLSPIYFETLYDYTNDTTFWDEIPMLMAMGLTSAKPSLLSGLGQTTFPVSFVADAPPVDVFNFNALTFNPLFSVTGASSLPIVNDNLYLNLPQPSYVGGYAKVGLDLMTFSISVLDSAYYTLDDHSVGVHTWSDTAGNSGFYTIQMGENPALDAHWGMGKTHDYFMSKHSRDSYDGNGGLLRNYMNGMISVGFSQSNAAALPAPYNSMVYGLGDGELLGPVVGLDVMGHEFTHLLTAATSNLEYQGEAGALNESFSDMFGTAIEFFTRGDSANWVVGEKVVLVQPGYIRSMSNPKAPASSGNPNFAPQPDTYKKQYWVSTTSNEDNGGVHTNSGVGNKWFYLLTEGGSGTNDNQYQYNVTGIGMEKSEKIAYRTLTSYLTPTSQYVDAYYASLQAADDLYGDTSQAYQSVKDAWVAVGVLDSISAGIQDVASLEGKVQVYPNPTTGLVTIDNELNDLSAELVSIVGARIQTYSLKKGQNKIDLSRMSKGIYILRLHSKQGTVSKKILLQ